MSWKKVLSEDLLMASRTWFSTTPLSQESLVLQLKKVNLVKTPQVEYALTQTDRALFTSEDSPYENKPKKILSAEVLTSPTSQALTLELLSEAASKASKILDVGCGNGYLSQCLARMAPEAQVFGIDIHKNLVKQAREISSLSNLKFMRCEAHEFTEEDFDLINVGFSCTKDLHENLMNKLVPGGVCLCPVENRWIIAEKDGELEDLGETGFSEMRKEEQLEDELAKLEQEIKSVFKDCEVQLGRKPNASEYPPELIPLLKQRRKVIAKLKALETYTV